MKARRNSCALSLLLLLSGILPSQFGLMSAPLSRAGRSPAISSRAIWSRAGGRGSAAPSAVPAGEARLPLYLPLKSDSVRFAVIGDSGTGHRAQYEVADEMTQYHAEFPFTFITMLGDNIYGSKTPADFELKFERPYKNLLGAGVKFYAALGNHDD